MECPFCKNSMEKGAIQGSAGRTMTWRMEKEGDLLNKLGGLFFSTNEKVISKGGFFERSFIEGYKCSQCNKIIVDSVETQ